MKSFGEYLWHHRNRRAMTMRDLSGKSGVSVAYISLCETGRHTPSETLTAKMDTALELDGKLLRRLRLNCTPPDVLALIPEPEVNRFIEGV